VLVVVVFASVVVQRYPSAEWRSSGMVVEQYDIVVAQGPWNPRASWSLRQGQGAARSREPQKVEALMALRTSVAWNDDGGREEHWNRL